MRLSELVESSGGALIPVGSQAPDPDVLTVVTTDLLDPARYLAGGELVLSGLVWWRPDRPERSRDFVAALVRSGAVALAAGEAELGAVPDDLVDAATTAGLPLLRIPVTRSFTEVIERATRLLTSDQGLVAVLARHRALLTAVTARETTGLSTVLDLVAADLGVDCWVLSAAGRLIASGTSGAAAPDEATRRRWAGELLTAHRQPHAVGGEVSLVRAGPRAGGWILAVADDHSGWTASRHSVVSELAGLVGLELDLAQRRPEAHVDLARALAGSSASDVELAVRRLGWDPGEPAVVVAADGAHAGVILGEAFADLPYAAWAASTAMVRTRDPAAVVDQLRSIVDFFRPSLHGSSAPLPATALGVSDAVCGGAGLLGAVAEARAALASATSAERTQGVVVGPDRLSSHQVLLAAVPVELRDAYRRRVLGPLLEHDRANRTDLVGTLRAYLESSGSWSRCAARMHLHVNTVRYRIERIEALTGRELRRLEDQADLLLALNLPD